jgi:DNA-binding SARP family transcriptional activator
VTDYWGERVEFGLLGPLLVSEAGTDRPVPGAKQRVLLAVLLASAGRVVPVDRIVELVWDGDPPAKARASLHNHVLGLRRALGEAAGQRIQTRAPGYLIDVLPGELDLARFTERYELGRAALAAGHHDRAADLLREALAIWRGEPLVDVPGEFARREAEHLVELRTEVLQSRIDADLVCGAHDRLVPELSRLVTEYPLRERFHAQLMLALYRANRQAEALAAYDRARQSLAAELGVDPGPELRDLHRRILRADPDLLSGPPTPGPPADVDLDTPPPVSAAPVPAALPTDLVDFTGRDEAVRHLCELLTSGVDGDRVGVVSVSAVAGVGGVGKTTLAVHTAHQVRDRFPDGQLYVSLHGSSATPVDPADVLGRFLRDLGVAADAVPADTDERATRYRSVLAGKRVLIVLDDAAGAEQVRPLIPGDRGTCVLVTSRARLTGLAGAYHLHLDVLSDEDAAELFAQIVGPERMAAEPEATADVLAACAGLPLAIRIAASRLASRPQWTIRMLADRLADERDRLGELVAGDLAVRASFQLSYANLETRPEQRRLAPARVFRLLGVVGGPDIGLPAAAALVGRPAADVERALELLVDLHLLGTPSLGRYQFHDLVRVFAAERAQAEEPDTRQAIRRLVVWYLHTAAAAATVLSPLLALPETDLPEPATPPLAFADRDQAVAWFDAELANLVAAVELAARHGMHELAWPLPLVMRGYLYLRKPWQSWISSISTAAASARAIGNDIAEYSTVSNMGIAFSFWQGPDKGIVHQERALQIARRMGRADKECTTLSNLAVCHSELGEHEKALECGRSAIAIARKVGNREAEAVSLNNVGETSRYLGRFDESLSYLLAALAIERELGDNFNAGSTLDGIAHTYLDSHRYSEARDYAEQAVALRTELDDRWGIAESLDRLATALHGLGQPDEAVRHWQRALSIYETLGGAQAAGIRARLDRCATECPHPVA